MRWVRALLAGAVVALLAGPAPSASAADDVTARLAWRYFDDTGHNVAEPFLAFYDRNGTDSSFGAPVTEAFDEDGRLVQYFQRARLEYWPDFPESQRVQLTNLGDLFGGPPEAPIPPERVAPDAAYYPETGHSVGGDFLDFLGVRGGTRVFGFPTTEPYMSTDGRLTQQFQRAILELWPENPAEQRVLPQLLGDRFLAEVHPLPAERLAPVDPSNRTPDGWFVWGAAEENATGYMPEKLRNVARSFEWLDGKVIEPGETFSYVRVLDRGGYELGLCYMGTSYYWCPAGGACSGASTFYRAWTNAGLQVLSRQGHTVLSTNPQLYGRDAAIEQGLLDLVVRNTSGTRLRVHAWVDWDAPAFHVSLEGERGPNWTVEVQGPYQDGPLAYRINYRKTFADGRTEDNWVATRYYSGPLTYIPPKP